MKNIPAISKQLYATAAASLLLVCAGSFCREARGGSGREISRGMEQAIRLYRSGQDNAAMDRFMEILVKGSPAERSMANDYLNRMTRTMNMDETSEEEPEAGPADKKDSPAGLPDHPERKAIYAADEPIDREKAEAVKKEAKTEAAKEDEAKAEAAKAKKKKAEDKEEDREEETGEAVENRNELMKKRIENRISVMRKSLMAELNRRAGARVYAEGGFPLAITIDAGQLFSRKINFRSEAHGLLSNLAGLAFVMGKSKLVLAPDGAVNGDLKIIDMRRTMALSSYLTHQGVSPARVEVNLMGTQLPLPSKLGALRGMIIIFVNDAALSLEEPDAPVSDSGPRISLGAYPSSISADKDEGALIEFSVPDSRFGPSAWLLQILRTGQNKPAAVVQEVSGKDAAQHQIYWNGKKDFFGVPYPAGNYVCVLAASDTRGRESVLRRAIQLRPQAGETVTPGENSPSASPAAGRPGAAASVAKQRLSRAVPTPLRKKPAVKARKPDLSAKKPARPVKVLPQKEAGGKTQGDGPAGRSGLSAAGSASGPQAEPASAENSVPEEAQSEFSGQVSYRIMFQPGTTTLVSGGEKKIRQVSDTMNYWPLAKLTLVGYAYPGEPDARSIAQNRANIVASVLADRYGVNRDRMQIQSMVEGTGQSMVEIKMVSKD